MEESRHRRGQENTEPVAFFSMPIPERDPIRALATIRESQPGKDVQVSGAIVDALIEKYGAKNREVLVFAGTDETVDLRELDLGLDFSKIIDLPELGGDETVSDLAKEPEFPVDESLEHAFRCLVDQATYESGQIRKADEQAASDTTKKGRPKK